MEYFENEQDILEKNPISGLNVTNFRIRYGSKEDFISIFLKDITSIEIKTIYQDKLIRITHSITIILVILYGLIFFIDKKLFNQLGQLIYIIPLVLIVGYLLYAFSSKTFLIISSCSSSIKIPKRYIASKQLFNFIEILEKYIHRVN